MERVVKTPSNRVARCYSSGMTVQEAARVAEHYRSLREDAMRIEASWLAAVRLTGPDTRSFLQGLATQDLERSEPGRGAITFFTTERGRPIAIAWTLVEADDAAWIVADETEPGALLKHFDRFRVMEDVEFAPSPRPVLAFAGPRRDSLLAPERNPEAAAIRAAPLSFLLNSGDEPGTPTADPASVEAWRIGLGLPRAGLDFGLDRLVTELAEPEAISDTKGCYVGQEVVARTSQRGQVRRSRTGFRFQWAGDIPGAEVRSADGRPAGILTSVAPEPGTGRGFGMGYLSTELRNSALVVLQGAATIPVDAHSWPLWT
jgi:folate-binding protein YgfZ